MFKRQDLVANRYTRFYHFIWNFFLYYPQISASVCRATISISLDLPAEPFQALCVAGVILSVSEMGKRISESDLAPGHSWCWVETASRLGRVAQNPASCKSSQTHTFTPELEPSAESTQDLSSLAGTCVVLAHGRWRPCGSHPARPHGPRDPPTAGWTPREGICSCQGSQSAVPW